MCKAVQPAGQGDYQQIGGLYDIHHRTETLFAMSFHNNIIRLVRIFAPYGITVLLDVWI